MKRPAAYLLFCAAFSLMVPMAANATDHCPDAGAAAESVMSARQNGVAMSTAMEIANKQPEGAANLLRLFIQMAYEKPRYSTEEYRRDAIIDFRNDMELACYQSK